MLPRASGACIRGRTRPVGSLGGSSVEPLKRRDDLNAGDTSIGERRSGEGAGPFYDSVGLPTRPHGVVSICHIAGLADAFSWRAVAESRVPSAVDRYRPAPGPPRQGIFTVVPARAWCWLYVRHVVPKREAIQTVVAPPRRRSNDDAGRYIAPTGFAFAVHGFSLRSARATSRPARSPRRSPPWRARTSKRGWTSRSAPVRCCSRRKAWHRRP